VQDSAGTVGFMAHELWDLWRTNCGIYGARTVGSYLAIRTTGPVGGIVLL